MIPNLFTIRIDVPALDALLNYLRDKQQAEIDAATARVVASTDRLKHSRGGLDSAQTQ